MTSFTDRVNELQEKQKKEGGKSTGELLSEAQEGFLAKNVMAFFRAMGTTDTFGVAYLKNTLGLPHTTAVTKWSQKPWTEQVGFLAEIAPVNDAARKALETISLFRENDLLDKTLATVIDEIVRPSRKIVSAAQLTNLLGDLEIRGLAKKLPNKPSRRAIYWNNAWYAPTNVSKSRLAWPFVAMAVSRVRTFERIQKGIMPRLGQLLGRATIDSDPEEQNLQKLLNFPDQIGSIVIWDDRSQIREDGVFKSAGLTAVLIGRVMPGSDLIIQGWAADKPLGFRAEEDYELPPSIITQPFSGGMEIEFGRPTHILSREEADSIVRIQKLLRYWLAQEGKFQVRALADGQQKQ